MPSKSNEWYYYIEVLNVHGKNMEFKLPTPKKLATDSEGW
jgi:hypothetical protein